MPYGAYLPLRDFIAQARKILRTVETCDHRETPKAYRQRVIALQDFVRLFEERTLSAAKLALSALSCGSLELLISGFGADRQGRPLTQDEKAARQTYSQALARKCAGLGLPDADWLEPVPDLSMIADAIAACSRKRLPDHIVALAEGLSRGCSPSERRTAAAQALSLERDRLASLAGFRDHRELEGALKESRAPRKKAA